MATTYKYYKPDPNLRAAYGGAAILAHGDSAETSKMDLSQRDLCRNLAWPSGKTRYIAEIGNDGVDDWMEVSDELYPALSTHLTATELATVVSSKPAGYTASSKTIAFQPYPDKIANFYLRGDSLGAGLGTTANDIEDVCWGQALNSIQTQTWDGGRKGVSADYAMFNLSIGSSTWANTGGGGPSVYPEREDLAYDQRIRTLPFTGTNNNIFIYWLGTNDIAYDAAVDGHDAWDRAAIRIAALRSEFPDIPIILGNIIKRGGNEDFGIDFNTDAAANYISAGADILVDLQAAFGDSSNIPDGTHPNTAGHAEMLDVCKTGMQAAIALL